jgi:predicted ATPase
MPHLEASFKLAQEHGMQLPLLTAAYGLAWARWRAGLGDVGALAQMRERRTLIRKSHYIFLDPLYAKLLADVEAGLGDVEPAFDVINAALTEAEQTGQSWFDAELHRTRGELLLRSPRTEISAAETALKRAIDVARSQQTRAFELRASLSLAKLYKSTNRAADADAILAPTLKGFTPTTEFPEIEEAQRLLDSQRRSGSELR